MMNARHCIAPALAALVLGLPACAADAPLAPGQPKDVRGKRLGPHAIHEECFALDRGDAVSWRFTAEKPVAFNVHYHEGKAVVIPVSREGVTQDAGRFVAIVPHDYCLMWEAGGVPLVIDYTLQMTRRR